MTDRVTLDQLGAIRRQLERQRFLDPVVAMDDPLHYIEPLHEAVVAILDHLGAASDEPEVPGA